MARYVSGSATAAFGQGLFGSLSTNTMAYLQGQINQLSGAGSFRQKLLDRTTQLFNSISSSAATQAAQAVLMQAEAMMGQDMIEELFTIPQLQAALPMMQGFIMDHPVIYQAWQDGKIEGYADTYVDPEPGYIGEERTAYRQVMHGVLRDHETQSFTTSHYFDYDTSDNKRLNIRQIAAIIDSQEAACHALTLEGDDPTSQYGGTL